MSTALSCSRVPKLGPSSLERVGGYKGRLWKRPTVAAPSSQPKPSMFRYTCVLVVVTVVAILFSQRYQTQREEKKEVQRLKQLDDEIRIKTPDELDEYCDTICKMNSCPFGQQDIHRDDETCICFDYDQRKCELN